MKTLRIYLAMAVLLLALVLSGCQRTWTVDFTKALPADLADWGGSSAWNLNEPPGSGLTIREYNVTSPIGFTSDFTLTLDMWMDIDISNTANFRIWVGDNESDYPEHYITCEFDMAGDEANEEVLVHEDGEGLEYRDVETRKPIPGFKNGDNVFRLSRKGDAIRITLNGSLISSFTALYFKPAVSYVNFLTDADTSTDVYFRKIQVSYAGDPVLL